MLKLLLCLFLTSSFLFWSGCCKCCLYDCKGDGGYFDIRLVRNGKNAVYGPDAFINQDSVRAYLLNQPTVERNISFIDTFQVLFISVENGFPLVLEYNSTMSDTFTVTTQVTNDKGCCPTIEVTSLSQNGEIICTEECEDGVIDIEI